METTLKLIPWSIATFWGSTKFVGHPEPEISGDEEGDPIWKPSNRNETGKRDWETAENNKLSITRSNFELENPDFA